MFNSGRVVPLFRILTSAGAMIGGNLSAGQRQLISLARSLLTPTNILGECCATVVLLFLIATGLLIRNMASAGRGYGGCRHRD